MARDAFWAKLHKQQIEQMLRIADETEDYVYDVLIPTMFELDDPDVRLAFYSGDPATGQPGVDMEALKANNPKLWSRYSKDALGLQQRDNAQKLEALDELRSEQEKQWSDFSRQIKPQQALGLGPAAQEQAGLGMPVSMGAFG